MSFLDYFGWEKNGLVKLSNFWVDMFPLKENDFDKLFNCAKDPKIWEQHPQSNRYERSVFKNYFEGAIASQGAFLVIDKKTKNIVGSSRFYDYNKADCSVKIGYTFVATQYWGKPFNRSMKELMMNYAFKFVEKIYFEIGANNLRSQKAIEKIGAKKIKEENISYYGESSNLNYVYLINRNEVVFQTL